MSVLWVASVLLVFVAVKYLQTNWWQPWRVQKLMRKQGTGGPALSLLHGHHKLNGSLGNEAGWEIPSVTHDIWARVMPFQNRRWKLCGKDLFYRWRSAPALFSSDFGTIKSMLRTTFKNYEKPATVRRILKPLLGDGLLNVNGEEWAKQRKVLNPVFRAEKLFEADFGQGMVETMVASSAAMLKKWEESIEGAGGASSEINVSYDLALLAVDIISRTAFGSSYEKGRNIFACLMELTGLLMSHSSHVIPPCSFSPTSLDKKISLVKMHVDTCIVEIIQERHNLVHAGNLCYGDDLLGMVMQGYDLLAGHIAPDTLQSLIDQCKTLYFAGADTLSSAMQWVVMLLALQPEWQEKSRPEVGEVTKGNTLTADMLNKLKIVEMVISVRLRLYPPAVAVIQTAARDDALGNLFIPKDIPTCICILPIHHGVELWSEEDALELRPDRFCQPREHVPLAYMPFCLGPRSCTGQAFAVRETKIALAWILHRFDFRLSPSYRNSPNVQLVLKPDYGVPLIVSKRC